MELLLSVSPSVCTLSLMQLKNRLYDDLPNVYLPSIFLHFIPKDDLLALNDGKSFEAFYKDIYPEELQLNKENDGYTHSTFLDLDIRIENGIFSTKLFDKRNDFGFRITRLPFRDSNIPCKMFYSSIAAECLRICRATSTAHNATLSIRSIVTRMRDQGANIPMMKNCISRALQRHNMNTKMGYRNNEFVNQLF